MLTRLLVNRFLINIAYMKIWVHLTFVPVHLRKPVHPVLKVSLEPCSHVIKYTTTAFFHLGSLSVALAEITLFWD